MTVVLCCPASGSKLFEKLMGWGRVQPLPAELSKAASLSAVAHPHTALWVIPTAKGTAGNSFYGLAIAGLYRLRRTRPDLPRPYRVPGYPLVPAVFIMAVVYLIGSALVQDPLWTSVTFAIVLAGVPVYYVVFKSTSPRRARQRPTS